MTCIAALVQDGVVHMGGDSSAIGGWDLTLRADPKVFLNTHVLIGFTGSYRFGQVLRYNFVPPAIDWNKDTLVWVTVDPMLYMMEKFLPAMRAVLKEHGVARVSDNQEEGGRCLVGYAGRLFYIDHDYQVGEPLDPYAAVGIGAQVAHGALYATRKVVDPCKRLRVALEAAERFSAGVRGPFTYEALL